MRWAEWTLAGVVFAGWLGEYAAEVSSAPGPSSTACRCSSPTRSRWRRSSRCSPAGSCSWSSCISGRSRLAPGCAHPGLVSNTFPDVFYFTYFAYHLGSITGRVPARVRLRALPTSWRDLARVRAHVRVDGAGGRRGPGDRRQLHVPRSKPIHNSLLSVMGPWPWYIASGAALALVLFAGLDLIAATARRHDRRLKPAYQRS